MVVLQAPPNAAFGGRARCVDVCSADGLAAVFRPVSCAAIYRSDAGSFLSYFTVIAYVHALCLYSQADIYCLDERTEVCIFFVCGKSGLDVRSFFVSIMTVLTSCSRKFGL